MTITQYETLKKYQPKWEIYLRAQTFSGYEALKELAEVRMSLRKTATNLGCGECINAMLNELYRHELPQHEALLALANKDLDKKLDHVKTLKKKKK
jgi:hypothetical protein